MLGSIIVALMFVQEPVEPVDDTAADSPALEATAGDEKEICRRRIVDDARSARGKKTKKVCKTAEEWREWNSRRTR